MKNSFVHYKVEWLEIDVTNSWNIKSKKLYFEEEALKFKKAIERSPMSKNVTVKKIIEFVEVIA